MRKNAKRQTWGRIVSIVMLAALIMSMFSGCYFLPEEEEILAPPLREPEEVTYNTVTVEKGSIERWVKGSGTFESTNSTVVSYTETSGRLKEIYVKAGDIVKEGDLIAELETGTLKESIEDQTYAVEKAKINLQIANNGGDYNTIKLRKIDLEQAQIKLDRLNAQLEAAKLYAPMSGWIEYVRKADPGASIGKYDSIAKIADPTSLQISFTHNDVSDLMLGMEIDLTFNNFEGVKMKGKIVQTPNTVPLDASESDRKSVKIEVIDMPEDTIEGDGKYTVELGKKKVEVEIGDSVGITVLLEKKEDIIVLPLSYINRYSTRRYVRVLKDGVPEERDVEIGIDNGSKAEIIGGIEVGELIIV